MIVLLFQIIACIVLCGFMLACLYIAYVMVKQSSEIDKEANERMNQHLKNQGKQN